jgi:hypothetical protein
MLSKISVIEIWFYNNFLICFTCSSQQKTIINAMAVNEEGVMVTGGICLELNKILLAIMFDGIN